jgi:uncharacterized oligopeptide transporter (OPT) family protein
LAWGVLPAMDLSAANGAPLDAAWGGWSQSLRYLGAGTMVVAGLWSLVQTLPMVVGVLMGRKGEGAGPLAPGSAPLGPSAGGVVPSSEPHAGGASQQAPGSAPLGPSADGDLQGPLWWGLLALALASVFGLYSTLLTGLGLALLATALAALASFVWVAVSSHIVGLVGSSNNPVSGMTLSALLGTALLLLMAGFRGNVGVTATLGVAAVVCCAACAAADCSQDLKTGHILGTSPKWQQLFEVVGAVIPALLIAPVLSLLHHAYGIGTGLKAPQATLFANLAKGVFGQGQLPVLWLLAGLALGTVLVGVSALCKTQAFLARWSRWFPKKAPLEIHPMAIAVGMYLPFSLSAPMALGGMAHVLMVRRAGPSGAESGTLFASGLVAGEALTGVALALLVFLDFHWPAAPWKGLGWATPLLTLVALAWVLYALFSKHPRRTQAN